MERQELRQTVLTRRQLLDEHSAADKSLKIMEQLWRMPVWQRTQTVMAYIAFRNEVQTDKLIDRILTSGRRVILPISIKKTRELVLYEVTSRADLRSGTYGIMEPNSSGKTPADPKELDLIIVPGVVFDRQGNRLGYGAGYYDRFLSRCRENALRLALAFDLQVVESLPAEPHDQRLDYVVTESEVVHCPPRR